MEVQREEIRNNGAGLYFCISTRCHATPASHSGESDALHALVLHWGVHATGTRKIRVHNKMAFSWVTAHGPCLDGE